MLREALQHIVNHPQKDKVWFTRPSAIYDHCAALPKGTMTPLRRPSVAQARLLFWHLRRTAAAKVAPASQLAEHIQSGNPD